MAKSKWGVGVALVLIMIPIGFVAGGFYASVTSQGIGLDAGLAAAGKVFMGGLVAILVGIILAVALPYARLRQALLVSGALSALAILFIGARIWFVQQERGGRAAAEAAEAEERRAAQRAEALRRGMPAAESLADPVPPPAGESVAAPPTSEAWRQATDILVGLDEAAPAPDVAFYYAAPNGPMALTRDAAYYHALMPPGRETGPCGEGSVAALFGGGDRLDLGTLTAERIERVVRERCPATLTAHGAGYARTTTLTDLRVLLDIEAQRVCADAGPEYVLWTGVDALPGEPLLLTSLRRTDGYNQFAPADSLRMADWPAALHRGRFRLPEGSRVSAYTAYGYPSAGAPAYLVQVEGTTPGGAEHPPIDVAYQAWYFVRGDAITPLVDNAPGSRCGPQDVDLIGILDLTGDGDRDIVFGPSLLVLERHRDGFRTRAAPRMPCGC